MKEMKIAICDDEPLFLHHFVKKLRDIEPVEYITTFLSGEELLDSDLDFHIIFLDVEMTGMNGIDTAFALRQKGYDGIVIFLTSHAEVMPEAFKVRAFRFLQKPIEEADLKEAYEAAEIEVCNTPHILLKHRGGSTYMKWTDIVYFEAYGDGTYLYHRTGQVYDTDKQLKYWVEQAEKESFFRIHKSYLVSLRYVKQITKECQVVLQNGEQRLPISRRNYSATREAFFAYIKKYAKVM